MNLDFDKLSALIEMREATIIKTAAVKEAVAPAPGTLQALAQRKPEIPDNSPNNLDVARAALKGGTDSYNFGNLGAANTANTDQGSHVNSLAKLFKPAHGNAKSVQEVASQQSKGAAGTQAANMGPQQVPGVTQAPQMKHASVGELMRVSSGDLEKVALKPLIQAIPRLFGKGKDLLKPLAGGARRRLADSWMGSLTKGRSPIIGPQRATGPVLREQFPHMGANLTGSQKIRNLLTARGQKQYWVGPGAKDVQRFSGADIGRTIGKSPLDDLATSQKLPWGTYSVNKPGQKVWHGQGGDILGATGEAFGATKPSLMQRWQGARAANAGRSGRKFSRFGRDITRGDAGKTLGWNQRNARAASGLGRFVPASGSVAGKSAKAGALWSGLGVGQTYYNPFYDVGLSEYPGTAFQIAQTTVPARDRNMSLGSRFQHGVGAAAEFIPYYTLPGLAAIAASSGYNKRGDFEFGDPLGGRALTKKVDENWQGSPQDVRTQVYDKTIIQSAMDRSADEKHAQEVAKQLRDEKVRGANEAKKKETERKAKPAPAEDTGLAGESGTFKWQAGR